MRALATAPTRHVITSRNPATGSVVFETPAADARAVAAAVERASAAASKWAAAPVAERAAVLARFADVVERDADELTASIVAEVGKVVREARGEVEWTAISARWYAEHPPEVERRGGAVVRRRPLGVVATVTPWNVPLITPAWKWLPALVAGNTVVWKPSELATGVAFAARARLEEAGLPPGVLEVVPGGPETARALCAHADVAAVHFTGSTKAGKAIAAATSSRKRCALEMGGLNFALVFDDADLARAADSIAAAATSINGQKCTATRRVLVARSVADELLSLIGERYERLLSGDPADEETTLGPLITPAARDAAEREVERAAGAGARVVARSPDPRGDGIDRAGFFRATVLADLAPDDPLRTHELFAPVLSVDTFADPTEAWRAANDTSYGLTAAVYTRDPEVAATAAERLRTGIVAVNGRSDAVELEAPFGGVKESGNGAREGGMYIYDSLTDLQAVYGEDAPG